MSNFSVDPDKIDYSIGNQYMKELYNEREVVSKSWEDFLALPKVAGYEQNIKRVPNDFKNVIDKKDDKVTTVDDCLLGVKVE